jgi:hypothetical protein
MTVTYKYMTRSLSWFGTGAKIKTDEVKLVV